MEPMSSVRQAFEDLQEPPLPRPSPPPPPPPVLIGHASSHPPY